MSYTYLEVQFIGEHCSWATGLVTPAHALSLAGDWSSEITHLTERVRTPGKKEVEIDLVLIKTILAI